MQEFALSLGYTFSKKTVKKVTWYQHDCSLAGYRSSHSQVLISLRNEMIASGRIDIGTTICSITTSKYNYSNSKLHLVEETVFGKTVSLRKIRENHLQLMDKKGLLRKTKVHELENTALMAILRRHKGISSREN